MLSNESGTIGHAIDYDIVPKVESLCKLTQQAAVRADTSASAIRCLTVEQSRINQLQILLGHIKQIQTALSKLSVPNLNDKTIIECAALLNSVGDLAVKAYEIRYGQCVSEQVKEAKQNALNILSCKLSSLFDGQVDVEARNKQLPSLLESFILIGAEDDGQQRLADLLITQFRSDLVERTKLLANVQFPFNARLSMIFDLMSNIVQWNETHLSVNSKVNSTLLEESSSLAADVLDKYREEVLGSSNLTDLRLLDLALTEAVSLIRLFLAFFIQFKSTLRAREDCFDGSSSLARFVGKYLEREKEYFSMACTASISLAKDEVAFEDAIFIATKVVRRGISTMDVETIVNLLESYNKFASTDLIAVFKKLGERAIILNCMATYSTLLEKSVERLESDIESLTDNFWSSKSSMTVSTVAIRSQLRDLRRLSDSIESQLTTALSKQLKDSKQCIEKLELAAAFIYKEDIEEEYILDLLSSAILSCSSGLDIEVMRRVYTVGAQLFIQFLSDTLQKNPKPEINTTIIRAVMIFFGDQSDNCTDEYFSPFMKMNCN